MEKSIILIPVLRYNEFWAKRFFAFFWTCESTFSEIKPILKEQTKDFKLVGSDIDVNAIEQAKTNYPLIDFGVLDIGSPLPSKWIEMSNTKP